MDNFWLCAQGNIVSYHCHFFPPHFVVRNEPWMWSWLEATHFTSLCVSMQTRCTQVSVVLVCILAVVVILMFTYETHTFWCQAVIVHFSCLAYTHLIMPRGLPHSHDTGFTIIDMCSAWNHSQGLTPARQALGHGLFPGSLGFFGVLEYYLFWRTFHMFLNIHFLGMETSTRQLTIIICKVLYFCH